MNLLDARQAFLLACKAERKSPKTMRSYGDTTLAFAEFIGDMDVAALTPAHVRNYIASLFEKEGKYGKFSSHSVSKHYAVIRTWLRWCYVQGFVDKRITDLTKPPRVSSDLPDAMKEDEIKHLFEYLKNRPFRDLVLIEFFLYTGCRISEVANLELDNVDLDQGCVKVHGKGDKDGIVPLPPAICRDLYVYIHHHRQPAFGENGIFLAKGGYRLGYEGMAKLIRRILSEVRTSGKMGAHTLRHTFATQFLRERGSVEVLRKILRHTNIQTTQIYTHLSDDDVLEQGHEFAPRWRK